MASSFEFKAERRSAVGTSAARALRRAGKVPAVLYGGEEDPVLLSLDKFEVSKNLENVAVYSHILTLGIDGKQESTVLKGLQRHPSKSVVEHLDFQRVSKMEKIRVHVPLNFLGEDVSVGVKKGGVVTHNMVDVEVSCLPGDLPDHIDVELASIDVGGAVHLSELAVSDGVEIYALVHGGGQDLVVASIQSGRIADEVEEAGGSDENTEAVDDES